VIHEQVLDGDHVVNPKSNEMERGTFNVLRVFRWSADHLKISSRR
jgi:hypothetical protein